MQKLLIALAALVLVAGLGNSVTVARAGQTYAECNVVDVATFNNRVHLHCKSGVQACDLLPGSCNGQSQGIAYYAVEVNSPMASSVIQIGLAAFASHRALGVFFDDDAGANPGGCNANDCRRILTQ